MDDLLERAIQAKRESKYIEFKREVKLNEPHTWCEIIKDIVAIANTGGGVILVGATSGGRLSESDVVELLELDPAEMVDKIRKYTNVNFDGVQVVEVRKEDTRLAAIQISATESPIVFSKPGTYQCDNGKQKTAFSKGTVYFRHGAKSEPATSEDIRIVIEKKVEQVRKSWMNGVKKVVQAPFGTRIVALDPDQSVVEVDSLDALPIRVTDDPNAPEFRKMDYDISYPYRRKELLAKLNRELPRDVSVNTYDLQCVRSIFNIKQDDRYCYCPKYSTPQYSQTFLAWMLTEYREDIDFFGNARRVYKEKRKR